MDNIQAVTIADDLQHALDFSKGLRENQILEYALKNNIDDVYKWYHRRIYTRSIQNIHAAVEGFSDLKPYMNEIYQQYLKVGGKLQLNQILSTSFKGFF